jgi:FkbM family methyltransferase
MTRVKKLKILFFKGIARIFILNYFIAEIVELEAKRKLGKLGGGESIGLEVKTALHFLDRIASNNPIVVFDIGANIGTYSGELNKLRPDFDLVAFEPSSAAFRNLKTRFPNHPKVTLVNSGVSSKSGEANLYFDNSGSGLASLSQRNLDHLHVDFDKFEAVHMVTGEQWVEEQNQIPTFVKIDVEGHELEVLIGFGKYLDSINLIQFEFGGCNIDSRTYFKDFWVLLSPTFDIYRITPFGPKLISKYSENEESFMTSNLIACKKT